MSVTGTTRHISSNFNVSTELTNINKEVQQALSGDRSVNLNFLMMKLGMSMINMQQDRLSNQLKDMTANLNKMTAANQLKEDLTTLRALRTKDGIADAKTMGSYSADTAAFAAKAEKAGISVSANEKTNWNAGSVTSTDIDALEARVKTMLDTATNVSQADNMKMQMINTNISQFTNMAMTFLDENKKLGERILR